MSKYTPKPLYVPSEYEVKSPYSYATDEQYRAYLDCLNSKGLSVVSVDGRFTPEQLKCAQRAFRQCPPGYKNSCSTTQISGYDTPIINPAPGANPKNDLNSTQNADGTVTPSKTSYTYRNGKYITTYGNSTTPGVPHMGGFRFMPATFKQTTKVTVSPEQYGYNGSLTGERFVSTTHQRVSGGKIIPLSKPLQTVNRTPRPLRSVDVGNEPWAKGIRDLTNLNETSRYINYLPAPISTTTTTNGVELWNSVNNDTVYSNGIPSTTPGTEVPSYDSPSATGNTIEVVVPDEYSPFDNETIRYNEFPAIDITPKTIDTNGNYVPAGPTVSVNLGQPTPEFTINGYDMLDTREGEEIILNGHKVVITGKDLVAIKTQVNCGNSGVRATFENSSAYSNDGKNSELVLQSCSANPITVANGCGPGRFKQVADFHINRGFEQSVDKTSSLSDTLIMPSMVQSPDYSVTAVPTVTQRFTRYDYDVDRQIYIDPIRGIQQNQVDLELPAIVQLYHESTLKRYTTSGSNYRVGDRLRLVGGTPGQNTYGPLTKICIDSAGAGYKSPHDVQIVINPDGQAPGVGAAAQVTRLDENGGIAEIEMINTGSGYDVENPPTVIAVDNTPDPVLKTIRAAWPEEETYPANTHFEIINETNVKNADGSIKEIVKSYRYVRSTAGIEFGTKKTYSSNDGAITFNAVNPGNGYYRNRMKVSFDTLGGDNLSTYLRPDSEVEILHYPLSLVLTRYPSEVLDTNTLVIPYLSNIYNAWADNGSHPVAIYRNDGGNLVHIGNAAYNQTITVDDSDPSNVTMDLGSFVPLTTETIAIGETLYVGIGKGSRFWIPSPYDVDTSGSAETVIGADYIVVEDEMLNDVSAIAQLFPSTTLTYVMASKPWYADLTGTTADRPRLVDTIDPRIKKSDATVSALVGVTGAPSDEGDLVPTIENDKFTDGYEPMSGSLRVAKFKVTSVDDAGGITGLKCIDRGLYLEMPADLPFGIPLEYDYYQEGSNIISNGGSATEHPDWSGYAEYQWNGTEFVATTGSPGAYDPNTYVLLDVNSTATAEGRNTVPTMTADALVAAAEAGMLVPKQSALELDPKSQEYGAVNTDQDEPAGGTGARLFITAQQIPTCSEKGQAKDALNLPDVIDEVNAPRSIARAINQALEDAGYDSNDIRVKVNPIGELSSLEFESSFPGLSLDSATPGFLQKLGLPVGDINLDMLCIEATLDDPTVTDNEALDALNELYSTEPFGLMDNATAAQVVGVDPALVDPGYTLSLLCVDRLGTATTDYDNVHPLNDNNSIFNHSISESIRELYKYDITNIFGESVSLEGDNNKQTTPVNIFESKRFNDINTISVYPNESGLSELHSEPQAWVDNFLGKGWAYLENGVVKEQQESLTDIKRVSNAIVYDADTGDKTVDLDFWDPFKGVLPGFVKNEIHYISEQDPVSYNSSRVTFGKNNVGRVWWDTSTVRYQWYEQGTHRERAANWGKTFPGSVITVSEWVESRALPENWTGDGTPRWPDRYVTERRLDPKTGQYTLFYYYWVQNRTVVENRVSEAWNRKLDTLTVARYIANPVGYGLNVLSLVSKDAMIMHNASIAINENDNHLQINFDKSNNPNGIKHTAWKLLREGDDASDVPLHISNKLIDSLAGYNADGQDVPDPRLSVVERYGIAYRPRQTMFKDVKEARRVMANTLNEILAGLKLERQYPEWDANMPAEWTYIERVNWYAQDRIDESDNSIIRYDASYKPTLRVGSVAELDRLTDLPDGTVVQVRSSQNETSELWIWVAGEVEFKQISIAQETIRIKDSVFEDDTNPIMAHELRSLLVALYDNVFFSTELWNLFFFELLKYAYMEQGQLDWAFKTSYLYIEKEEEDLVQFNGFKPDNFQKVLDYINEVKPYTAKIREYKDGKRAPIEYIGRNSISDFDKPPYVDPLTNTVRVLDDNNADDVAIMENDIRYVNYTTIADKGQDPIRHITDTITFDRTNWQLTEWGWDRAAEPLEMSIAKNIAYLTQTTGLELESNVNMRAADRIFMYDVETRATFVAEINTYFNDDTAYSNASIVGNAEVLYNVVAEGQLKNTLALVKTKVGGDFRGEEIDAGRFYKFLEEIDYQTNIAPLFGYDSLPFDDNTDHDQTVYTDSSNYENYGNVTSIGIGDIPWDATSEIVNYEGILGDTSNVTLVRNDEVVEGFDGVTFQRVGYGENRPEELILLDPLETVIMTVWTNAYALGNPEYDSIYDPTANAIVIQHVTVDLRDTVIEDAGIGYVNPTITVYDAVYNMPVQEAELSLTLDSNGSISAVTVDVEGLDYTEITIVVEDTPLTLTVASTTTQAASTIEFDDVSAVLPGQRLTHITGNGNVTVGTVESVVGNTVYLDYYTGPVTAGDLYTVEGVGASITAAPNEVTANVIISASYAYDFMGGVYNGVQVEPHPTDANLVIVPDVVLADINVNAGADTITIDGVDYDVFYEVNTENGFDSATSDDDTWTWDGIINVDEPTYQLVAPNAANVAYRKHISLFGDTDYLRLLTRTTVFLAEPIYYNSEKIVVKGDYIYALPEPTVSNPGVIWVGDEKIMFGRRDGDTLSLLTRGVKGTTIQEWPIDTPVLRAEDEFNNRDPRWHMWLDYVEPPVTANVEVTGFASSLADRANIDFSDEYSIMLYLHDMLPKEAEEPYYTLTVDNENPDEGDTISAVFETNQFDGTYYWYVEHGSTTDADFISVPPKTDSRQAFTVINGRGLFDLTTLDDYLEDIDETFTIRVSEELTGASVASVNITLNNTFVPSYNLTSNINSVNEGEAATLTFTTNMPDGTFYYYIDSANMDADDFGLVPYPTEAARGTFVTTGGVGTILIPILADEKTEGEENFNVHVARTGTDASVIDINIVVNDTSFEIYGISAGEDFFALNEGTYDLVGEFIGSDIAGRVFTWEQIGGVDTITITDPSSLVTSFTTPTGGLTDTIQLRLYVDKGLPTEQYDDVTVYSTTVDNTAPPSVSIATGSSGLTVNPGVQ